MKASKKLQTKLEELFAALDFRIRYEKGTFKSGYCLLETQKVIVINKFFPLESKIKVLVGILKEIEPEADQLDIPQLKLFQKLNQIEFKF